MLNVKTIGAAVVGAAAIGLSVSSVGVSSAEAAIVRRDPNNSNFVIGVDDIDIDGVT